MPAYSKAFRERLREGAVQYVERIPVLFSTLQRLFRTHDPVGLISTVTIYGLQRSMRADGSTVHHASGLEQHHVELLQAILLSVPYDEWSDAASMPQAVQDTMDTLRSLSLGFLAQRINAGEDHEDIQARTIAALQERVRLHTLAVRNWGYFGDVVSISKEIYAPLDEAFLAYHGFAATDVVEIGRAMVDEFERRMRDWSNGMAYSLGAKTAQEMARRYLDLYPDAGPTREYLADLLPPGSTPQRGKFILMPHFDLHLPEVVTFDIATVSEAIDRYFDARDAGRTVPKPRTRLRPYFASLAKTLSTRRPPGWTIMGMHLLGAASPEEQTRLERLLAKARKAVRTRKPGMEHGAIVSVTPPLDRKASMAFFVHDWADREARNAGVEEAAARTLRESDDAECIVFARHIDRWAEPYEMACVARSEPVA